MGQPKKKHMRMATRAIERAMLTRACGTCVACCTTQGVGEINKPPGVPCPHLSPKKGCGIYATRPPSCAEWSCGWRMGLFDGADRPDRVGVVMDLTERSDHWPDEWAYVAREVSAAGESNWKQKAEPFLDRISRGRLVVLLRLDGTRTVIGPPDQVAYVEREVSFLEYDRPRRRLPLIGQDGQDE